MFYEYVKNSSICLRPAPSILDIQILDEEVNLKIGGFVDEPSKKIEFSFKSLDLRNLPSFTDMTTWLLPFDASFNPMFLVNKNAESMLTKQGGTSFQTYKNSPLKIYFKVYFKTEKFSEIGIRVMLPEGMSIQSNIEFVEVPTIEKADITTGESTISLDRSIIPQISGPSSIAANGICELNIEPCWQGKPLDRPVTVYLRHEAGYLPKTVLECQGKTSFKVHALGLEAGDRIEINAGFRFWSGEYYHTLEVV